MFKRFSHHLYALGKRGMPGHIDVAGRGYDLATVLKHDFVAATGLYRLAAPGENAAAIPERVVLKIGRQQCLFGLPLGWLGRLVRRREVGNLERLKHIGNVPHLLARYGKSGYIYGFIEGRSLDEHPVIPEHFFEKLERLVREVHKTGMAYMDMNKRGNILVGSDGDPYLIDFQISLYLGSGRLLHKLREYLQAEDMYHILKHKRRLCPEQLRPGEMERSRKVSAANRMYRATFKPYRSLRRFLLRCLYRNGLLIKDENARYSDENDPSRYLRLK